MICDRIKCDFLRENEGKSMKKNSMRFILGGLGLGMMLIASGCSEVKPLGFEITQEKREAYQETDIASYTRDNYDRFIHQRYILIYDDQNELLYIPIDNTVTRHQYQWELLVTEGDYKYYQFPDGTKSQIGIDVSKYQKEIDWQQVAAAGIDYAMIRVGYRGYGEAGKMVEDEKFRQNIEGAVAAGIPVGVYFYSQAVNAWEGAEEARFVLERIQEYPVTLPVVIDTEDAMQEDGRCADLSVEDRTAACVAFCETVKTAGYKPMVYANRRWFALDLNVGQLKDYDFWYAQYANEPDFPYEFAMWQYTQEGRVPGISEPVDLNIMFRK